MSDDKEQEEKKDTKPRRPRGHVDDETNQGTLGMIGSYAGKYFSLNMKVSAYFGIGLCPDGTNKMWLSKENWFDVAPGNLDEEDTALINSALRRGVIVSGKQWIPALDKDKEVKAKYVSMIASARSCDEPFKDIIRNLVAHKRDGNYTALEILRAMIKKEQEGRDREVFVSYLKSAIDAYTGPVSLVEDFPSDPDNFTVVIDPVSNSIVETTKKTTGSSLNSTPISSEERSSAISSALD